MTSGRERFETVPYEGFRLPARSPALRDEGRGALHLSIFEQPDKKWFFQQFADGLVVESHGLIHSEGGMTRIKAAATAGGSPIDFYRKEISMKKNGTGVMILVLTVIAVMGIVLLAHGQEKAKQETPAKEMAKEGAPFVVKRLVIGTGVENLEPAGVAETFPASTEKVSCFLEATDIAKDTEVSFVWFNGEKELSKFSVPLKEGPRWRTYADKNLRELKGDWKVEVRDSEGKVVKEVKFKVE